ncbi:MAG: CoA transferase, partial [Rhodospirillales bacterium]
MNASSIPEIAAKIWRDAEGDEADLSRLSFSGEEPVLPSLFRVDAAAGASIGLAGLAAAALHRTRTGEDQQVSVDLRHAAAAFRGEYHVYVDDGPSAEKWKSVSGYYQAGDGRWIQLHCNFPHFRDGILKILGAAEDPEDVTRKVAQWQGQDLETALIEAGLAAAMMRSPEEWAAHPQSAALTDQPLFTLEKIGDAPPEQPVAQGGPMAGMRVLDLSRVIAGPVCGRTLAGFGADVFRISSPDLPFVEDSVIATGFGKYAAHIDLRRDEGQSMLANMIHNADVFAQ